MAINGLKFQVNISWISFFFSTADNCFGQFLLKYLYVEGFLYKNTSSILYCILLTNTIRVASSPLSGKAMGIGYGYHTMGKTLLWFQKKTFNMECNWQDILVCVCMERVFFHPIAFSYPFFFSLYCKSFYYFVKVFNFL